MSTSTHSDRPAITPQGGMRSIRLKLVALYALILGTAAACYFIKPAPLVTEPGVVMKWPAHVLDFTGQEEPPQAIERKLLPEDTQFAKMLYTNPSGTEINVETVLSGVEHRSIHRPEICLRGQGWDVKGAQIVTVPLKSGRSIDVMVLSISRPVHKKDGTIVDLPALYAYFFVSKDAETARHFDRVAITNLDLLLHNKAHRWAYVIAMAEVLKGLKPDGLDHDQTLQLLKDMIREAAPTFLKSEVPASTSAPSV